jgi:hypothetical protein
MIPRYARDKRKTFRTENTIYLHIYLGDSNCTGAGGKNNLLSAQFLGDKDCKIFYKPDRTLVDNGVWQNFNALANSNRAYEVSINQCAMEVFLADKLATYQPGKHGIIKYGLGGSEVWQTATAGEDWAKGSNELYNEFVNYVYLPAITKITASGFVPIVKSITISLGTNDAGAAAGGEGDNFYTNLVSFCNSLKTDCSLPSNIKWLILLPPPFAPRTYLTDTRQAARNFVNGRSTGTVLAAYSNSFLVDCDLLAKQSDNTHYTITGFRQMADLVFPLIK